MDAQVANAVGIRAFGQTDLIICWAGNSERIRDISHSVLVPVLCQHFSRVSFQGRVRFQLWVFMRELK